MNEILEWPHCRVCGATLVQTKKRNCFLCRVHGFSYPRVTWKRGRPRNVAPVERADPLIYKPYKD